MYGVIPPPTYILVPLLSPAVTSFPHLTPPPTFQPLAPPTSPQLSRIHFASAAVKQAAIANGHGLFCLSCAVSTAFDLLPPPPFPLFFNCSSYPLFAKRCFSTWGGEKKNLFLGKDLIGFCS